MWAVLGHAVRHGTQGEPVDVGVGSAELRAPPQPKPRMLRVTLLALLLAPSHALEKRREVLRAAAEARSAEIVEEDCPCGDKSLCKPIGGKAISDREIFGFYGNGDGSGIDFTRVTTVAWAFNPKVICYAHAAGARVVMAAPSPETVFGANSSARSAWVEGAIQTMVAKHNDGIVFDWESPCDPGAASQRVYAQLVAETRDALRKLSPSYQVTVCVAWSPDGIDGRNYDMKALAAASDLLYIMDYDTRSQVWDACVAGANAPYFGMVHGIQRYLDVGIKPAQLVLGVPWYGYSYPCLPGTKPDSPTCPTKEVPFRGINCSDAAGGEVGYASLIAMLPNSSTGRRWDAYQGAAWFNTVGDDGAVSQHWYDDVQSLSPKYAYARAQGLRGVGPYTFGDTTEPAMFEAFDAFLKGA